MAFLRQQLSSRKRPSSSSPFVPPAPKVPKSAAITAPKGPQTIEREDKESKKPAVEEESKIDLMVSVLAEAGCTLINPNGSPSFRSDLIKFRRCLERAFSFDSTKRSNFLRGFSSYIQSSSNFRRVLISSNRDAVRGHYGRTDSLVRNLLLVPSIQTDMQQILMEKLPEFFVLNSESSASSMLFEDDIARLILNQFRWLDFLIEPSDFTNKLLQVISVCPLHLKKEIIGSLPEIIGDQNNQVIVESLELMLQEDPDIIVSVLDSFSNLNLDEQLDDQVITIALSCINTVEADNMPYLLRFLLLSAAPSNVRRIISHIREQLKFVCSVNSHTMRRNKLKGKLVIDSKEALILDALRSNLRFKKNLCEEILKEIKSLERAEDHKIIDIWLLVLIHTNCESLRRSVEIAFRKKVIEKCITIVMVDQCVHGNKDLVKDYFASFLSVCEHLVGCKEQKSREFGSHLYLCMFEELNDTYSRQEILGALITHIGSGCRIVVDSALEILLNLASNHSQDLGALSSHISGILDFLEGFTIKDLHKVYEVFSRLTFSGHSSLDSGNSSFRNELLVIVRKQVSNPDLKYKNMGIIGTLKVVSYLGNATTESLMASCQKENYEEAIELLSSCLDSCKQIPLQLALFYDELCVVLNSYRLHDSIIEWLGKHLADFESVFLSDLDSGKLTVSNSHHGLEGEYWMNLDGDISPVFLNILQLVSSSQSVSILQTLPANFHVLSMMERSTNQGSLAGIDALLGCPLYLPSSKYFGASWKSLNVKQKETICLCLHYACNWLRELLNAFSTQIVGNSQCTSQVMKEEIRGKLLKRLGNLVYLESLLNYALQQHHFSLPVLYLPDELSGSSYSSHFSQKLNTVKKSVPKTASRTTIKNVASRNSDTAKRFSQPSILDAFNASGAVKSHMAPSCDLCPENDDERSLPQTSPVTAGGEPVLDICETSNALEPQRSKFRPLSVDCYYLMVISEKPDSSCLDFTAELPLHSYLLHDFIYKISQLSPSKQSSSGHANSNLSCISVEVCDLLKNIRPFIKNVRRYFDSAFSVLQKGEFSTARHPELTGLTVSNSSIAASVFMETLSFICKVLSLPEAWMNKPFLLDVFEAFQPVDVPDHIFAELHPSTAPGTICYLYCGVYLFLEEVLDSVTTSSFKLALEVLHALQLIIDSSQKFLSDPSEGKGKHSEMSSILALHSTLQKRLGESSLKLLKPDGDNSNLNQGWKSDGKGVEKILSIYLESGESTVIAALQKLTDAVVSQITGNNDKVYHGFFTLCPATLHVWYRTLHEKNLSFLNKLVIKARSLEKRKNKAEPEVIVKLLVEFNESVNVFATLILLCKTYGKVSIHAMAVKHGGKFVDTFLRAFEFLKLHFHQHSVDIVKLMKDLQKATRTVQIICSEAKGSKQTVIASKIPATKRSMERLLFCVKALLHNSSECTFEMGNLKHKDLQGEVVSSQAYVDDPYEAHEEPVDGVDDAMEEEEPCVDIGEDEEN